nr:MAG TPA: hypothetical protein [Caudoviricetes sp.]
MSSRTNNFGRLLYEYRIIRQYHYHIFYQRLPYLISICDLSISFVRINV